MRIVDIIEKKKVKEALSSEEINFWIDGLMDQSIADYQSSALLMAIVLNGMDDRETSDLTMAMLNSGNKVDLSRIDGLVVDKHSTGGVGDKSTLVLGPIVAACGAKVAKMSGRGLGHTGGTVDKLESIENYEIELSEEDFIKQVNDIGIALIGQTENIAPADKKLYALRDVTGTVDSIPLIAASIMSKKLASGADTILLDVKYGDGAFMQNVDDAKKLASLMSSIGKHLDKNVKTMISSMNEPLGLAIGNSLEVIEAIETLKGSGPADLFELTTKSAAIMLQQANLVKDIDEGLSVVYKSIEDKSALLKLKELIKAQGGNEKVVDDYSLFPTAKNKTALKSKENGYLKTLRAQNLGRLAMELGAGRESVLDSINYGVGLVLNKKVGDIVSLDEPLVYIYHDNDLSAKYLERLYACFEFSDEKVSKIEIIDSIL